MNIIEPGLKLIPNVTKLIHCDGCDTTWAGKKIPSACPYCGAGKSKVATAKDDACESFLNEYQEMMERSTEEEEENTDFEDSFAEESYDEFPSEEQAADQTTDFEDQTSAESSYSEGDTYEPIGYDPDEFMNNMLANAKAKKEELRAMLQDAEQCVKETKWALQRAGLPTDAMQSVLQDIRSQSNKLGKNLPGYTDLMLKMVVDNTLQHELRHPRKGKTYTISSVNALLEELEIKETYWDSYYSVAGIAE